jgi:hypothetical protein
MTEIIWEDPPINIKGSGIWIKRLTPLMDHPNRWARVATLNRNSASAAAKFLRERRYSVPPGRWEFQGVSCEGRGNIYARYLGPMDPDLDTPPSAQEIDRRLL